MNGIFSAFISAWGNPPLRSTSGVIGGDLGLPAA
jgi:hypothetical protein